MVYYSTGISKHGRPFRTTTILYCDTEILFEKCSFAYTVIVKCDSRYWFLSTVIMDSCQVFFVTAAAPAHYHDYNNIILQLCIVHRI